MQTNEVGKKALAEDLGWSRPTLDKRLDSDPNFPVLQRGGKGGGWKFDPMAVRRYLTGQGSAPAVDDQAVALAGVVDGTLPTIPPSGRKTEHSGEATATQRYKESQAALNEDRLRRQRGELVEASDMRQALSTALAELKSSMTDLPGIMAKEFGWSERETQSMRTKLEAGMRQMSRRIRDQLTDA